MFSRISEDDDIRELFYTRIFSGNISNLEELQRRLRNYFELHYYEDSDDEIETITNPNFMQEKDINYRLYPIYINWKKLEANEEGYYKVFVRFGYFGVAIYSAFKKTYPNLNVNNIMYNLASVVSEYLFSKDEKSESVQKNIKNFFEKIPDLEKISELVKEKILLLKEMPIIFLVLKIYEVYFLKNKKYDELKKVLQFMYLIGNYITDEEFKEMYSKNYKGKINKIFKTVSSNGKEYKLQKTKPKLFRHIKMVYNKNKEHFNQNSIINNNSNVDN